MTLGGESGTHYNVMHTNGHPPNFITYNVTIFLFTCILICVFMCSFNVLQGTAKGFLTGSDMFRVLSE